MTAVTQADDIRRFVLETYVDPVRRRGQQAVAVRAGDVHRDLGLTNAFAAVCSAIGSNKFKEMAGATLQSRTGPANGANVYFTFHLTGAPATTPPELCRPVAAPGPSSVLHGTVPDLRGALVLIACVKSKLPHAAVARTLYTSAWFQKTRDLVEASGARWFILSSRFGLVDPAATIETYDFTLNTLGVAERRTWASRVMAQLSPHLVQFSRIVMFAGERYREFLVGPLRARGITVDIPMANLTRGEQLGWLSANT